MKKFTEAVLKFRIAILVTVAGLTIFFGVGLTKVTINSDILSYLDPDNPTIQIFNKVGDEYGGNTIAMVAVESDDIFTTASLSFIHQLTEDFGQIVGVESVISLTNVVDIKKTDYGIEISKLIDKEHIPTSEESLKELRDYTLNKDMYTGKLVSVNGKVTVIVCNLSSEENQGIIAQEIKRITEKSNDNFEIYYGGLPLQLIEINDIIVSDLINLIPIVIFVVFLVLYISFRSKRGIIFPLSTVILSSLWSVGLMGWLGVELSIISNIMPILLIAIGTAYGIHLLSKYYEDIQVGDDKIESIKITLEEIAIPIVLTGITTLVGFLSFVGSSLTAVTEFGVFTAFGVGIAMLLTLTYIPATLSFMKPPKIRKDTRSTYIMNQIMGRLSKFILNNEKRILMGGVFIIIIAVIGIPQIKTQVNMTEYFSEDSEIRISDQLLQDHFGGSLPIQILIEGDLKNPAVLNEMFQCQKYLESLSDVNASQSLADLVCEMNDVLNGYYAIPNTREQVANLLFLLEGESMLSQMVNKDYSEGLVQARFANFDTEKMINAVKDIDDYLLNNLDTTLLSYNISEIPEAIFTQLREEQINKVVNSIVYDSKRRNPFAILDKNEIKKTIDRTVLISSPNLLQGEQNTLLLQLVQFFEEEADIEIDSHEIIQRVVLQIVAGSAGGYFEITDLAKLLRKEIPLKYWSDEPEIIEYSAEDIELIIKEKFRNHKINQLLTEVHNILPEGLRENPKFTKDLRGNLSVLTETTILSPRLYDDLPLMTSDSLRVSHTGMLKVLNMVNSSLLRSQIQSLVIALVLILILMMIQFKSVGMGIVVTAPIILTVLINFAVMAYGKVPLDNATMMISSIAIGIGIDYAIHFSTRFKEELKKQGNEYLALEKTLETTGRAIIINAFTVALGFIILLGSKLVPLQSFGALIALTMATSAWGTMTFLPSLILVFKEQLFPAWKNKHF